MIVPLRTHMVAFDEAVRLAEIADTWPPHPSRARQQIAFVPGVEHVWDSCRVTLNACAEAPPPRDIQPGLSLMPPPAPLQVVTDHGQIKGHLAILGTAQRLW